MVAGSGPCARPMGRRRSSDSCSAPLHCQRLASGPRSLPGVSPSHLLLFSRLWSPWKRPRVFSPVSAQLQGPTWFTVTAPTCSRACTQPMTLYPVWTPTPHAFSCTLCVRSVRKASVSALRTCPEAHHFSPFPLVGNGLPPLLLLALLLPHRSCPP